MLAQNTCLFALFFYYAELLKINQKSYFMSENKAPENLTDEQRSELEEMIKKLGKGEFQEQSQDGQDKKIPNEKEQGNSR